MQKFPPVPLKLIPLQLLQPRPAPDTMPLLEPLRPFVAVCSLPQAAFHILDITHPMELPLHYGCGFIL